ncbi:metal-dependent hydrolase [Paenibacillus ehimensis]|uniref:Metal-dependent hydrolase n=1 Tax=Paenibacillus ehimensis TaxID=79264 RepID=A0ABT8VAH1_9BACL|nr:metal-dependent hydrolase [Paenibacillus ehimensis]MDO3677975.1 metal-dependent hydrolase [Paenibacillus ehimensis]MEC0210841.1 metal-dependent hydrolase [Paenibacillus ehimensis]
MLQKTHSVAGLLAAEGVLLHFQVPLLSWDTAAALLLGCLAGPLADIDKQGSTMAKVFFPLSFVLRLVDVRHRTLTHSVLFLFGIGALLLPLLPEPLFWSFLLAYASHAFIDLFNEQGVELLWPIKLKFRLLPKFMAIETGSFMETGFRYILLLLCIALPVRYYWDTVSGLF